MAQEYSEEVIGRYIQSLQRSSQDMGDMWPIDGYHLPDRPDSYDVTFKEFLMELGIMRIDELIDKLHTLGHGTNILDLMGGCYMGEHADSLTGVRLENIDEKALRLVKSGAKPTHGIDEDEVKAWVHFLNVVKDKRKVIEGDVFVDTTWTQIQERARTLGSSGYDIIFFRPMGPIFNRYFRSYNPKSPDAEEVLKIFRRVFYDLLEKARHVLSPIGMIFAQAPSILSKYMPPLQKGLQRTGEWESLTSAWDWRTSNSNTICILRKGIWEELSAHNPLTYTPFTPSQTRDYLQR